VRGVTTGGERFSRSSIILNCSTHVISWFKNNFFYEHKYMSIHHYECMYTHCTLMNIFERLRRLDLKIHEVGNQERLAVDRKVVSH
jgi:hypothetical protein